MKQWIIEMIVKYLIENLTDEKIKEWTDKFNNWAKPYLLDWKVEIFQKLRSAAADTATPLDNMAVDALEKIVDQYLK